MVFCKENQFHMKPLEAQALLTPQTVLCYRRVMVLCVCVTGSGQVCRYPDCIPSHVSLK